MCDEDLTVSSASAKARNSSKGVIQYKSEFISLQCEWEPCDVVFQDLEQYLDHISFHLDSYSGDELDCCWYDCGFMANNLAGLRLHVNFHAFHAKIKCFGGNLLIRQKLPKCTLSGTGRNLIPELPESLVCCWNECNKKYDNPEFYFRHVETHCSECEPKGSVACLWDGCDGHFQGRNKLRDHVRSHTQEKLVACPNCGALFANRTKFLDHIKRQTPMDEQNYQCSHCHKRLPSERLLKDHMRHHVNHYRCPYCDMTCPSPSSLDTHMKYRHLEKKPFMCDFCTYSCKSQTDLRKHLHVHAVDSSFKCRHPNCNYEARNLASLRGHIKKLHMVEASWYMCHVCEKKFTRGTYLTSHLFKEHKYRWPSGHSRFRYQRDSDGFFRLQTIRYESVELTQEMMNVDSSSKDKCDQILMKEVSSTED